MQRINTMAVASLLQIDAMAVCKQSVCDDRTTNNINKSGLVVKQQSLKWLCTDRNESRFFVIISNCWPMVLSICFSFKLSACHCSSRAPLLMKSLSLSATSSVYRSPPCLNFNIWAWIHISSQQSHFESSYSNEMDKIRLLAHIYKSIGVLCVATGHTSV